MEAASPEGSTEGSAYVAGTEVVPIRNEDDLIAALGISINPTPVGKPGTTLDAEHVVVPDPHADEVDLSDLRGTRAPTTGAERISKTCITRYPSMTVFCLLTKLLSLETMKETTGADDELHALAEIVPEVKSQANREYSSHTMTVDGNGGDMDGDEGEKRNQFLADDRPIEVLADEEKNLSSSINALGASTRSAGHPALVSNDSMQVHKSGQEGNPKRPSPTRIASRDKMSASSPVGNYDDEDQNLGGFDDVNSENALDSESGIGDVGKLGTRARDESSAVSQKPQESRNTHSSNVSLSTATQTHEVRMPMYLPTFKPATGCTNASDFIVRCFVARLRSGITVVKHGRSRWCKSRLRILHIHQDGRSLSWKPAVGEPSSSKRPPKLDLSTCTEVRHAWSPDPLNPMFTGTPILRQKCEAANAHKSFALIFPKRTVDITAVTADQCKVLMEGFSALCFRLQVANLAGRGRGNYGTHRQADDVEVATTASVTLTNNSTSMSPAVNSRQKRR